MTSTRRRRLTPELAALQAIGWPLAADEACPTDAGLARRDGRAPAGAPGAGGRAAPQRLRRRRRPGRRASPAESLPEWQRAVQLPQGRHRPRGTRRRWATGCWSKARKASSRCCRATRAIKRAAAGEHYKQQLIAANIDTVFVVCGLDADFNPRRIERYLLLVRGGGVEPVVVLTKADKAETQDASDALAALVELAAQDVAVRAVNAKDRDSVAGAGDRGCSRAAPRCWSVSSGAGKSTLTNTLLGIEKMKTSEVRESDSRGRHTTTHRALIPLPSGACLIDTPGMRELKPTGEEDVAENFSDIEALAEQCRFRDCGHEREPGCAVRAAIEAGTLDPQRFANYLKLRDEVAGAADKLANRRAQKANERCGARRSTSASTTSTAATDAMTELAARRPPPRRARRAHGRRPCAASACSHW